MFEERRERERERERERQAVLWAREGCLLLIGSFWAATQCCPRAKRPIHWLSSARPSGWLSFVPLLSGLSCSSGIAISISILLYFFFPVSVSILVSNGTAMENGLSFHATTLPSLFSSEWQLLRSCALLCTEKHWTVASSQNTAREHPKNCLFSLFVSPNFSPLSHALLK